MGLESIAVNVCETMRRWDDIPELLCMRSCGVLPPSFRVVRNLMVVQQFGVQ